MKNGWKEVALKEASVFVSTGPFGSMLHKSDYVDNGVPVVNPTNMLNSRINIDRIMMVSEKTKEKLSRYTLLEGDVVVARRGELGRCAVVGPDEEGWLCGTGSFFVRPLKTTNPRYLSYLFMFTGVRERLEAASTGATMKNLSNSTLSKLAIPLPPPTEQKRIVAILDDAFERIDTAIANTEMNIENSRELFESYLDNVFTWKGDGWTEFKLDEVCDISSKLVDPRKTEFVNLPHVGAANMISMSNKLADVKSAKEEGLISGKFLFDSTMVLYSKIRPYLRKVSMPSFSGLCSADVYPLSPRNDLLNREYLFFILLSKNFTEFAIQGSGRVGMPKVNRDHLFKYSLNIPPLDMQRELVEVLDSLSSQCNSLASSCQNKLSMFAELKQSLLQKAFAGELTNDFNPDALEH